MSKQLSRRILSCALSLALALSMCSGALAVNSGTAATSQYASQIEQAQQSGLMSGYGNGQFGENDRLNRAMWVTILENMYKKAGAQAATVNFSDVKTSDWFADGVGWAVSNKITGGYPDASFKAAQTITRQELAVMSYQCALAMNQVQTTDQSAPQLSTYADGGTVASWAATPYRWCLEQGILRPDAGNKLNPTTAVTRGEAAACAVTLNAIPKDFDRLLTLEKDFSQAAQLPLTGYYTKQIDVNGDGTMNDGRTVKVYIANEASIRSYFTVVAIPDGVQTDKFLAEQGWFALMDEKGEGLFVLEPGAKGWGTAQEEAAYLKAATDFLKGGMNTSKMNVFSTFGEFYLVGYGKGATALEAWSAANPILVISQVYADGASAGTYLTNVSSTLYDGKSANGDISDVLPQTLTKVGTSGQIAPKDVPVPTWLAGYTGSDAHWKTANDCIATAVGGVYHQSLSSNAYQTEYANQQLKAAGAAYGISQVKVTDSAKGMTAADFYKFMSAYTRYDTTFAYSNVIAPRLDYTAARVAAQQTAKTGKVSATLSDGTQILAQSDIKLAGHGTVQVGVMAFSDNNGDGKRDPREYMLYIPEGFQGQALPILMIYPGNTQTDSIFMDSTLWWQVAEEEGIALAFVCETYNASPSSVSHADSDKFYGSLVTLLGEKIDGVYADLDFSRLYGSGQSAGSNATQGFAVTNPEFFAAVASTSAAPKPDHAANQLIPTMMVTGQMDVADIGTGFASQEIGRWATYMLGVNGFDATFAANKASAKTTVDSRHPELYTWSRTLSNGTKVPLFQWSQCLLRPHNCYPSDIPMLWDFLEHFSKNPDGSRYYSPSAFEKNDATLITQPVAKVSDVASIQAYTDETMYGTGVVQVDITYKAGKTPTTVKPEDYVLMDRGSLTPDFGYISIDKATVKGNVVTLAISGDTAATPANQLVYTGAQAQGARVRNALGVYCTGAWYRDTDGTIYYGKNNNDAYANNTTGMGYQVRESLELKLYHTGESPATAACLAKEDGSFNSAGVWKSTIDRQFGQDGFQSFEQLGIQIGSTAAAATDGTQDAYVRGYAYIPAQYNPANGIVFTLQGQGISYWQLPDGTNNDGTGIMFDSATTSWADQGAIVVNIHDRSSAGKGEYYNSYDFVVDDCKVMEYFIDKYNVTGNIVLQGNSRGTMASSIIIKALAGQSYSPFEQAMGWTGPHDKNLNGAFDFNIDVFICQNGSFGGNNIYTQADYEAVAKTGLKVWCFNGEQDTNDIPCVAAYRQAAQKVGAKLTQDDIRLTTYSSNIYSHWGESDHSTTRINGWYFDQQAYYGSDVQVVDGQLVYDKQLSNGDTYQVEGRGAGSTKLGHQYKVYDELFQEWALGAK